MKSTEIRKYAQCCMCGKKIGTATLPLFFTIEISCYKFNHRALERQTGFEMMLGSAALAEVLGPDEDLAEKTEGPIKVSICFDCCTEVNLIEVIERGK